MKELRFDAADGVWSNEKRFYKKLIEIADRRFDVHLKRVKEGQKTAKEGHKKEKK